VENEDAPVVKKSVYELKEEISEELKQMQLRVQEQIEESNKKQIQQCRQQNEDFRKYLMDVQIAIDNQTKQQSLLQNLILDLKNSKIGFNPDNLESEKKKCVICLDKDLSVALVPCGHMFACKSCAKKMPHVCPICRSAITDTLKIYFP
jgi:rubrerythrin